MRAEVGVGSYNRILLAILVGCALAATGYSAVVCAAQTQSAEVAMKSSGAQPPDTTHADSLRAGQLIQPDELAHLLAGPAANRPTLLHVGFKVLYESGHIAGSRYVGAASKPEGLAALEQVLKPMSRNAPIVLYCGCCPWNHCPNVAPAFHAAQKLGFKRVKVLFIAKDLGADWIDKGLPTKE